MLESARKRLCHGDDHFGAADDGMLEDPRARGQYWCEETEAASTRWQDSGLVQEGLRLFRDLPLSAPRDVLLATHLHAGNITS